MSEALIIISLSGQLVEAPSGCEHRTKQPERGTWEKNGTLNRSFISPVRHSATTEPGVGAVSHC